MLSVDNIYYYPKRSKSNQNRIEEQLQNHSKHHHHNHHNHHHNNNNNSDSLSSQLENDREKNEVTDAHMRLWKSDGDHFTFLNIYKKWIEAGMININIINLIPKIIIIILLIILGSTSEWCENSFIRFSALKTAKNIRTQLINEAEKLKQNTSSTSTSSSTTTTTQLEEKEEDDSKKRKKRDRESDSSEKKKRSRRDLENSIKQCLVSGLYMNTARLVINIFLFDLFFIFYCYYYFFYFECNRRCANETAYRSMPFQINRDHNLSNDWQLQDMLEVIISIFEFLKLLLLLLNEILQ